MTQAKKTKNLKRADYNRLRLMMLILGNVCNVGAESAMCSLDLRSYNTIASRLEDLILTLYKEGHIGPMAAGAVFRVDPWSQSDKGESVLTSLQVTVSLKGWGVESPSRG